MHHAGTGIGLSGSVRARLRVRACARLWAKWRYPWWKGKQGDSDARETEGSG